MRTGRGRSTSAVFSQQPLKIPKNGASRRNSRHFLGIFSQVRNLARPMQLSIEQSAKKCFNVERRTDAQAQGVCIGEREAVDIAGLKYYQVWYIDHFVKFTIAL